jgi:hypothetical protein
MSEPMASRVERMFARDRLMAWICVAVLWATVAFVYVAVGQFVTDTGIRVALAASAIGVLLFNTASIVAMVRHYRNDRDHIYGSDLRHLDEARARRRERP